MDYKETARNNSQVDRAIGSASRAVEGLTHRKFYPWTGTRYFPWPNNQYARSWRLWLDADELISVSSLVSGGTTIGPLDYFLEPINEGPPYTHIEIDLNSNSAFYSGSTHQRNIAVTGVFGHSADTEPAGELAEVLDNSETAVDVTDSEVIGVGQIIQVGLERMIVTGKSMLDTGQNLGISLTASTANTIVAVSAGTAFHVGETVLLDSERMLVVDIAGNNLTVKRAWDGSVLAVHAVNSDIYALRTLTVQRGALGTTATTHNTATAISKHRPPELVNQLCIAEAVAGLQQQSAGYARVVGSGDGQREARGAGLVDLRAQTYTTYGRKARIRAV